MLYAAIDGSNLIVGAASTLGEFKAFYSAYDRASIADIVLPPLVTDVWLPLFMDTLVDSRFDGLKQLPVVFYFETAEQRDRFAAENGIQIVPPIILVDKQKIMIKADEPDPYAFGAADKRTIGEIHNLMENDPFDRRTDAQKEKDAANKIQADKMKKEGKLTGDSFAPGQKKTDKTDAASSTHVTDIEVGRNEDGSISIDSVKAWKGVWSAPDKNRPKDTTEAPTTLHEAPVAIIEDAAPDETFVRFSSINLDLEELEQTLNTLGELPDDTETAANLIVLADHDGEWFVIRNTRLAHKLAYWLDHHGIFRMEVVDANMTVIKNFIPDPVIAQHIDPNGRIAIFHRIDVAAELEDIIDIIEAASAEQNKDLLASIVAARGYIPSYSWLACATRSGAEKLAEIIKVALDPTAPAMEIYGVNDLGERLVPKGVQIVEAKAEAIQPRPWNDRVNELETMTEDEAKENRKTLKPKEFIFCGSYLGVGNGTILYVTPRTVFAETEEPWKESLEGWVDLPNDLKEIAPGVYKTKSRDWTALYHELQSRGFVESMFFMLYFNNL